jgi:hypothetical protein
MAEIRSGEARALLQTLLRPPPHRGPLIAAGAVAFVVGVALEELRLRHSVALGVHCVILLATAGLLLALGLQAPTEGGRPPAYQSVLLVAGLLTLYPALLRTADVLGADFSGALPAGAFVWTALVEAGMALWAATARRSAVSLLIAAIAGGIALLEAWRWIFHASSQTPYRWLLLLLALALVLASLVLRTSAPRHAEQLVNAAGLAIAVIGVVGIVPGALVALLSPFGSTADLAGVLPNFWELVLLAAGCGLVAFGALDRSPGPAYLGVVNLLLFIAAAAGSSEPTLYWWPLLLLLVGGAAVVAGLRPRRPLPPEPPAYRAGEQPLAARAEDEEIVLRVRDDRPPPG